MLRALLVLFSGLPDTDVGGLFSSVVRVQPGAASS